MTRFLTISSAASARSGMLSRTPQSALQDDDPRPPKTPAELVSSDLGEPERFTAFAALLSAYRRSGGTTRGDDLGLLLEERRQGDYVSLARLLVAGDVFGFEWRRTLWFPMFQFEPRTLSVRRGPRQVLLEFAGVFDGWELATWYATENAWLADRCPVDVIDSDLPSVLDAARADRFIAAG